MDKNPSVIKGNLTRFIETRTYTMGQLDFSGHEPFYTIELPWNFNMTNTSCIPEAVYNVMPFNWEEDPLHHFKRVYEIKDVKDRQNILIHNGNWASDSKGCIIIGMKHGELGGKPAVLDSNLALSMLKSYIGEQPWSLTITYKEKVNG
jgi:hypothetical protein